VLEFPEDQRTRQELSGRIDELHERVAIDAARVGEELLT